ncbi:MAG TPA: amino acid aminotransferase [Burkholderiales bacterium]|nr:amino acid aminotransferase [Burkholderiales bacterium]
MSTSLLARVEMAPADPILGVTEAYNAEQNPKKVNLGVGVYYDDQGKVPVLECVRRVERDMLETVTPKGYLPIDGIPAYDRAVQHLAFGADSAVVREGRAITVQALGGTGALKVAADFLRRVNPGAQVWISDPSWENHRALFEGAGFTVNAYPYYQAATHGLDFGGMTGALEKLTRGTIVVLHACCHNPTGVDLTRDEWTRVLEIVKSRELVPILDIAYQGFADGVDADGEIVRQFAAAMNPVFVANSFSKSFSLYGERVGALSVAASSVDEAKRALSQLKRVVRMNYSNPPTFGAKVVAAVLTTAELRELWDRELGQMRHRIKTMRKSLVDGIHARVPGADFSFVLRQRGMFSYSGLTKAQVLRLREEFGVYVIETGRICVAALNSRNVDYAAEAIARVLKS